jgi:hypothetical protein
MIYYRMVKRHTKPLELTQVANHTFRATGNHASVNTTKLYDYPNQKVSMDDVVKITYRRQR